MRYSFFSRLFLTNVILFSVLGAVGYFSFSGVTLEASWVGATAVLVSLCTAILASYAAHRTLRHLLRDFQEYSRSVADSGDKLLDATEQFSTASTHHASAVQEAASTITQLNATIKRSVENANRSLDVARNSQQAATAGQDAVNEMIKAMDDINSSNKAIITEIDRGNQNITDIVKVITEISTKTRIINDIVFQTKLLSFNASVEAARAGEHGKGFAVVAEEIGKLAQMSGNASREIAEMLNGSIKKVNSIIQDTSDKVQSLVENGKVKVEAGTVVAHRCGDILNLVVKNATDVNSMISDISLAAKEQSQGMNEITIAMNQIESMSSQNVMTAEITSECSKHIYSKTEHLRSTLERFERGVLMKNHQGEDAHPLPTETPKHTGQSEEAQSDLVGEAAGVPAPSNVLTFEKRNAPAPEKVKKAVGANIPSEEDIEFEDV